jgi:peptidyl-tRNA hydrolase, PTH1 family
MKLIFGLGNPEDKQSSRPKGLKYKGTRHNLGFEMLDEYAKKHLGPKVVWEFDKKFNSEIIKLTPELWLIKPQTFMNNSGQAVVSMADYFKVTSSEDIIVIHDDLDLILGRIKVRKGGAAGGHHGVESIISSLGSDQFIRIRLGIGNAHSHSGEKQRIAFSAEHFVLEGFLSNEKSKVKTMTKHTLEAIETLLEKGLSEAQNQYN